MFDNLPVFGMRGQTRVYGCVLIGGRSTRLGTPKHLLKREGKTWLERTVEILQQVTEQTVIVGDGELPANLRDCIRLYDVPEVDGPMAGILAAMRWAPQASWLVAACDLPNLSVQALRWLLEARRPGVWATLPKLPNRKHFEPLLAHYDFRSRLLLERMAQQRSFSFDLLASSPKVITVTPPAELASAWVNINTPEQLHDYLGANGSSMK